MPAPSREAPDPWQAVEAEFRAGRLTLGMWQRIERARTAEREKWMDAIEAIMSQHAEALTAHTDKALEQVASLSAELKREYENGLNWMRGADISHARAEAAEAQVASLSAAKDALQAERDRLRTALQAVEYGGEAGACPSCAGKPHMDSCELAAALSAAQEAPQ